MYVCHKMRRPQSVIDSTTNGKSTQSAHPFCITDNHLMQGPSHKCSPPKFWGEVVASQQPLAVWNVDSEEELDKVLQVRITLYCFCYPCSAAQQSPNQRRHQWPSVGKDVVSGCLAIAACIHGKLVATASLMKQGPVQVWTGESHQLTLLRGLAFTARADLAGMQAGLSCLFNCCTASVQTGHHDVWAGGHWVGVRVSCQW
jgi:hypothetical protein